jgi:hypothetical protein
MASKGGGYRKNAAARLILQQPALNLHRRWRCDNAFFTGSIRGRLNHPLPADMATSVDSPCSAAALVNLHSPVVAVSRNCERICHRRRCHHSAQHSNKKDAHDFSIPHNSLHYSLLPWRVRWILQSHSRVIRCSLFWINAFSHTSLSVLRNSASSRFRLTTDGHEWLR